jgi:TPR repeat protein
VIKKWSSVLLTIPLLTAGCAETAQSHRQLTSAQIATCSPYVMNNGNALYKAGKAAYFKHEYVRAMTCYQFAASHGHTSAQFDLGQMYEEGEGAARDMSTAVKWYTSAANAGNTNAQFTLGVLYATGNGVEKNTATAVYWQRKAAEAGNIYAQTSLGIMYSTGQGVEKSYVKAYAWLSLAAEKGFPLAREKQTEIRKFLTPTALGHATQLSFKIRKNLSHPSINHLQ